VIHRDIVLRRFAASRRVTLGAALLGVLVLVGLFAEILASPAPLLAKGPRGVELFPAVLRARDFERASEEEIARSYEGALAVWPLVRAGPSTRSSAGPFAPSSRAHPLGTDEKGRDLFARLVYGSRNALGLSLAAVVVSAALGVLLGGLSGIRGGTSRDALVRLVETVDTFPAIIVVALVRAIEREPSSLSLVLAVAAVRWAEIARLVHAETLRGASEDYALAARALGASRARIFLRHVLPNALGPVTVSSVFGVASIVLLEAAISFLEMGAPTASASWGETLAEGARNPSALRLLLLPFALLLVTVGGSYLVADALRDAMDPRSARAQGKGAHPPPGVAPTA
jgi:peptide/nickel transport system permease protein